MRNQCSQIYIYVTHLCFKFLQDAIEESSVRCVHTQAALSPSVYKEIEPDTLYYHHVATPLTQMKIFFHTEHACHAEKNEGDGHCKYNIHWFPQLSENTMKNAIGVLPSIANVAAQL